MTAIKICGLTREEDVEICDDLGVEYLGLNFIPASPRCITLKQAEKLRTLMRQSKPVGIFFGEQGEEIDAIADILHLTYLQIYDTPHVEPHYVKNRMPIRAFRTIPDRSTLLYARSRGDLILLDGPQSGEMPDYTAIKKLPGEIQPSLFLAGGLKPENVQDAIRSIRPYAVDVASGVESEPGKKSYRKIQAFVSAVRSSLL